LGMMGRIADRVSALNRLRTRVRALRLAVDEAQARMLAPGMPPMFVSDVRATTKAVAHGMEGAADAHREYVAFEDVFYDSTVVDMKMQSYVPAIVEAVESVSSSAKIVADLGCGRGELMCLLRAQGIETLGAEINAAECEDLQAAGLDVRCTDANAFLAGCEDASLAAVVVIQVVEHLEPEYFLELIGLFGEKIAPGGIAIVETPNPKCLAVAGNFYLDLTHKRPYPVETVQFYLERAGFAVMETKYLMPCAEAYRVEDFPEANYTDYAVVARR